ncbi:MAG: hypothetical protein H7Y36_02210 [Armatimonadetes bacterium]|nr:hypothetical protein [Akkermansiaceae bacterium]
MKSVCCIPINEHLGLSYDDADSCLIMPHTRKVSNYWGDVSFCAQFTLAESASAQFLIDALGMDPDCDLPTLRKAEIKFFKPTRGESRSHIVDSTCSRDQFQQALSERGKVSLTVVAEVRSEVGEKSVSSSFSWLVLRNRQKTEQATDDNPQ